MEAHNEVTSVGGGKVDESLWVLGKAVGAGKPR